MRCTRAGAVLEEQVRQSASAMFRWENIALTSISQTTKQNFGQGISVSFIGILTYESSCGLGYLGTKNKIKDYDSVKNVIDFNFITITVNRLYVRRSCLSNKVALLTLCDEGPSSISSFAV
jgi:hypothetical protein